MLLHHILSDPPNGSLQKIKVLERRSRLGVFLDQVLIAHGHTTRPARIFNDLIIEKHSFLPAFLNPPKEDNRSMMRQIPTPVKTRATKRGVELVRRVMIDIDTIQSGPGNPRIVGSHGLVEFV